MTAQYNPNEPAGKRIRALVNAAFEDSRREALQLEMLDSIFEQYAAALPDILESACQQLYRRAIDHRQSKTGAQFLLDAEKRNPALIEYLTTADQLVTHGFIGIKINSEFTTFSARDIMELPGYIKLHLAARKADIAISLTGVVAENGPGQEQPMIMLDARLSYEEGGMRSSLYPSLPEPQPALFDASKVRRFEL